MKDDSRRVIGLFGANSVGVGAIVAAVLYALGFGAFAIIAAQQLWPGAAPEWLYTAWPVTLLALLAPGVAAGSLTRRRCK